MPRLAAPPFAVAAASALLLAACTGTPAPRVTLSGFRGVSAPAPTADAFTTVIPVFAGPQTASAAATGVWSAPVLLPVIAIHTTLLHTGEILFFGKPRDHAGSEAWIWDPVTRVAEDVSLTYERNLFCAAHLVLPDGRVLVSGGHEYGADAFGLGAAGNDLFDPATRRWTPLPSLETSRWYPSIVGLPDGDALVFAGQVTNDISAASVERFDLVSGEMRTLPSTGDLEVDDYPRMHLLGDGSIVQTGEDADVRRFDLGNEAWTWLRSLRAAQGRYEGNSVLLPDLQTVLTFGGEGANITTTSGERLAFSGDTVASTPIASMRHARMNANAVMTPDGGIIVVGGGERYPYVGPVRIAERYDPDADEWTELGAQRAARMYHSTAILLPDATILSAGQDFGPNQFTAEIFKPPYLFAGPRPSTPILPSEFGYDEPIEATVSADTRSLVLVRPGSVTHSIDFAQRQIPLTFTHDGDAVVLDTPATATVAPPGWYMLFALSDRGVPSEAAWIHLG